MPTTRTRRPRPSNLSAEAAAWVASEDAVAFFERPAEYPLYAGRVTDLPGVRPWWGPLPWTWLHHRDGTATDANAPEIAFVLALHREFMRLKARN